MTTPLQTKPFPHRAASNPQVGIVDPGLNAHFDQEYGGIQQGRVPPQYLFTLQQERKKSKLRKNGKEHGKPQPTTFC